MEIRTRNVLAALAIVCGLAFSPMANADPYWQCVPFARLVSGIQIFGDAHTWWRQAEGHYETGKAPAVGGVLVFKAQGRMRKGHVATVSGILNDRLIQVTHANWSEIDGRRGQVEENAVVVDVSDAGDWSKVKVWYEPAGDQGATTYSTFGFIYQDEQALHLAQSATAAIAMASGEADENQPLALAAAAPVEDDPLAALIRQAAHTSEP